MLVGQQLGPFAVEKELGSGAMGAVYRGRYTKTGQLVAIKVMAPGLGSSDTAMARFEREAGILKQLKHPNIVRLFATGKSSAARPSTPWSTSRANRSTTSWPAAAG